MYRPQTFQQFAESADPLEETKPVKKQPVRQPVKGQKREHEHKPVERREHTHKPVERREHTHKPAAKREHEHKPVAKREHTHKPVAKREHERRPAGTRKPRPTDKRKPASKKEEEEEEPPPEPVKPVRVKSPKMNMKSFFK